MSKKEPAKAPAAAEGEAPKSKKKLIIVLVAVFLLLAGGGGAAWFFLVKNKPAKEEKKKKEPEATAPAIFVPLDRFTVNLVQENGDQVLQVGVTLKTYDPELDEKIKKATPEIHSRILELLSSKRASQLSTVEGKKRLTAEILYLTNRILGFKKAAPPPEAPAVSAHSADVAAPAAAPPTSLAAALQQAQPQTKPEVAAAPAKPVSVTEFLPDVPAKGEEEDREGVVDVLYTDFIIQ